jgi:hypothetical protein
MKNRHVSVGKATELNRNRKGLKKLGFKKCGKDELGRIIWRIQPPYYVAQLQLVLGNYPASNPNCGVLSIHHPEEEATTYSKKGKKKKILFKEKTFPIAWYIDSYKRLHDLIISLTQCNI